MLQKCSSSIGQQKCVNAATCTRKYFDEYHLAFRDQKRLRAFIGIDDLCRVYRPLIVALPITLLLTGFYSCFSANFSSLKTYFSPQLPRCAALLFLFWSAYVRVIMFHSRCRFHASHFRTAGSRVTPRGRRKGQAGYVKARPPLLDVASHACLSEFDRLQKTVNTACQYAQNASCRHGTSHCLIFRYDNAGFDISPHIFSCRYRLIRNSANFIYAAALLRWFRFSWRNRKVQASKWTEYTIEEEMLIWSCIGQALCFTYAYV